MYLPPRLISVPSGTSNADKCYCFSFNLFTAAVDGDGRARKKKTPSRLFAIQTSRSVHRRWKQSALKKNTLSKIAFDDGK